MARQDLWQWLGFLLLPEESGFARPEVWLGDEADWKGAVKALFWLAASFVVAVLLSRLG
ncbi:MAG: hypothetical protein HQL56_05830 [Magnetococcales bacterium]|nr:hypothetical protein [Magnetococcales bacterium]